MWIAALLTAQGAEIEGRKVHDPKRPVALGSRVGMWTGPYSAPAVGGHIKLKVSRGVGLEGFSDNTLRIASGVARHDHVIGFSAYFPRLLGGDSAFVSPTLGSCVDFRVDTPMGERLPSNTDILFGAHGGLMGEVALGRGWSLQTNAQVFGYVGNAAGTADWTVSASNKLHWSAVGQILAGLNYTL